AFLAVPVFLALLDSDQSTRWRRGFSTGWLFGLGYFAVGFHWIGFAFLIDAATYLWMLPFMLGILSGMGDRPRVVIFSGQVNPASIEAAVQAGAWGYISKNDGEDAIVDAVDRIVDDQFILSSEVRQVYSQH
ncbi:MAG: hypothetical protein K2Q20_09315, partial [Phycisphaerales bacterium]|nr:hypothetical protein [Phycisphaerales bacterium]